MSAHPLLRVEGLRVALDIGPEVLSGVDLTLDPGEIVGLVGESGSGKTTLATALLGHARPGARITGGTVTVGDVEILGLRPRELRRVRGGLVGYVAQDPATALNPALRIGTQLAEMAAVHLRGREVTAEVGAALEAAGLPSDRAFLRRYPHQLSGGQQQRVLIALAFLPNPRLVVLDEPTTALDVTTQARVLASVREMCRDRGAAAVYVSHDLGVVRGLADRVAVMYAGRVVETAPLGALFSSVSPPGARHPYTRGLLAASPDVAVRGAPRPIPGHAPSVTARPPGCAFAPRCVAADALCRTETPGQVEAGPGHVVACHHPLSGAVVPSEAAVVQDVVGEPLLRARDVSFSYGSQRVLHEVSLDLREGAFHALVGESGSGKTTLARVLSGFGGNVTGDLSYAGEPLAVSGADRPAELRRRIQYVFQNPYRALNPRHTVAEILRTPIRHLFGVPGDEARRRALDALGRVALRPEIAGRRPGELSGGERQRVAVARALVCEPSVLICDEITSALDVSVQAAILELLTTLRRDGLTVLFVTHDLGVVRAVADEVSVMHRGRIVEHGRTDDVLDDPEAPYTRSLVTAARGAVRQTW
ncbi:dipeptide ABC transporter ATP-binding protein [Streptosporangium saharense]|uniref:Peptide/nickel transport system ATP-binding protein n=1 Tax=Streptosporangium saharense TaxID=1706840 RepID=A0A7W7VR42_9ACTN|nr:ABC transporter ATP-binding protein [Streptosporangium saharense]MBB4919184.1 peptide/nickel transport system ATP-binding protein [Streptosporangium saharense]